MAPTRRTTKSKPLSDDEKALLDAAIRFDAAFRYFERDDVDKDEEDFISCIAGELVRPNIFSKMF